MVQKLCQNYETMSTLLKFCGENCGLFSGHGVVMIDKHLIVFYYDLTPVN